MYFFSCAVVNVFVVDVVVIVAAVAAAIIVN